MAYSTDYYNWYQADRSLQNQYNYLSPYLSGMMNWLTSTYGGQNLGGYVVRNVVGGTAPSAHSFGSAIDWGYSDRAQAEALMNTIASDPGRWGIQEIHDYSGQRVWKVGQGWKPQTLGSHGGAMKPESKWIEFQVAPSNWNQTWNAAAATETASSPTNPTAAPVDPAARNEMTSLLGTLGVSYSNAPSPTPALLAFLRGVGLNLSTAEDVKARAIERIGASTADAMADIDRAAGRTKQNVTADLARRDVLSSGEANKRYARHAEDVAEAQSDVQRQSAAASEAADAAYKQARDLARQQALERTVQAEQQQSDQAAMSSAEQDRFLREQQAADVQFEREMAAREQATRDTEALLAKYGAA